MSLPYVLKGRDATNLAVESVPKITDVVWKIRGIVHDVTANRRQGYDVLKSTIITTNVFRNIQDAAHGATAMRHKRYHTTNETTKYLLKLQKRSRRCVTSRLLYTSQSLWQTSGALLTSTWAPEVCRPGSPTPAGRWARTGRPVSSPAPAPGSDDGSSICTHNIWQ